MVTIPKKQGGLGVTNLSTHNDAMLLKYLHKFYTKADIPWVNLIWENYYSHEKLPGQQRRGSFWWRDVVKLLDTYKGIAFPTIADGSTVLFWHDLWNGTILSQTNPQLFSFAKNANISYKEATDGTNLLHNFNIPLSTQAYEQLTSLEHFIE